MPGEACPFPTPQTTDEREIIRQLLDAKRIAVIGISDDPNRPSHYVSEYLISAGKDVVFVNPKYQEVLGRKCYPRLTDVPGQIDLVNVFRRPLACADVTRDAIDVGAKGVWLQSGITNAEAERLAREAGIPFVQNRCIMVEHSRRR
jgi:uncharacterized protein